MRHVVVLGSGLAGIRATTALEKQLEGRRHIDLTLVSESTHFVYRPLLPHVVSGALETTDLSVPLETICRSSTDVEIERIRHIDPDDRTIVGEDRDIPFDYLIVAPSAVADWGEHPKWRAHLHPFQTLGDAADTRRALTRAAPPDRPDAGERLVVVGAGPNGVELAGELRWALDRRTDSEAPRPEVLLVDRADAPLPGLPPAFRETCREQIRERGIEFRGRAEVVACRPGEITLEDGTVIRADSRLESSLFWCGGTRPPDFIDGSVFAVDAEGRLRTDPYLSIDDHYGMFAAGSAASPPESGSSSVGAAARQGETAARNLLAELSGRTPNRVRLEDPTWPLSLGPDAAAVYRNGTVITGTPGWALYRLIHTSLIPGAFKKVGLVGAWLQEGIRRASD